MQCFKNAKSVAQVDLLDRGFHYGDGCFTTARVKNGQIELAKRHFDRLTQACQTLKLDADLVLVAMTLAHLNHATGTLKIMISRGVGPRGYSLPHSPADVWVIYYPHAVEAFTVQEAPTALLSQRLGLSMPSLVGVKSLNRLEQVLLKAEADALGYTEALVCDLNDQIIEGVSSNCFIRLNNTWITPELRYNGVHGVMRAEILARMQRAGISCEIRAVDYAELSQIQSLFFCNALHAMNVASHLAGQALDTAACHALFYDLQLDQIA